MIRQQHGLILEIYHYVDVFLKSFSSVRSLSTKLLTLLRLPEPFRCRDFHRNRKSNDVRFLICHCLELKKPESERFVILVSWFLNRWLFLWQPNFLQCCFFIGTESWNSLIFQISLQILRYCFISLEIERLSFLKRSDILTSLKYPTSLLSQKSWLFPCSGFPSTGWIRYKERNSFFHFSEPQSGRSRSRRVLDVGARCQQYVFAMI